MSKHFRVLIAIIATVVSLTSTSRAQSTEKKTSGLPATLSEAVELAIQNRTEMRMETMRVAIQETEVKIAKSAFYPTLDFLSEGTRITTYDKFSGYIVTVPVGNQIFTAAVDQAPIPYQMSNALELKYNLYAGGKDLARLEEARSNQASAEYGKDATRHKIVLDVATAYWELRKSQITSRIAERWRDYYLTSLRVAETQLKAGRISAIDKEVVHLHFQEQEVALAQAHREINDRVRKYRAALGRGGDEEAVGIQEVPQLADDPEQQDLTLPEQDLPQHPELLRLKSEIQAAHARRKIVQSEFLPNIDFFARYAQIGRDLDSFPNAYDDLHRYYYIFGLRLTMNLFEGFKTRHQTSQATITEELARAQYAQRQQELSDAVQERSMRLAKAKDDLTLTQQRLQLSEAKERIARAQRQTGKYSELEYQKEQIAAMEEADKVLLAKIAVALERLNVLLVSIN